MTKAYDPAIRRLVQDAKKDLWEEIILVWETAKSNKEVHQKLSEIYEREFSQKERAS